MDLSHIISPYSRVIEYSAPPNNGFYTFPHNDDHPQGWGKPFVGPKGEPIEHPGTPVSAGGTDPIWALVYRDNGEPVKPPNDPVKEWQVKREPGNWLYGNIDWRGPIPEGNSPWKREKLSYFGPNTRYFSSPNFVYGSDDKHHEIYQNGQYLAIAPKPVLGAAIMVWFNPDTGQEEKYLIVVCRDDTGDVIYSRLKPDLVSLGSMTPALRSEMMRIANPPSYPEGWVWVTGVGRQIDAGEEALSPSTPWFFSSDGMEAQCMREMEKSHNNGVETVTEVGLFRYKLSFTSPHNATFLNLGNKIGYNVQYTTVKDSLPHFKAHIALYNENKGPCPTCPIDPVINEKRTEHFFALDSIRTEARAEGTYVVAVDYHENEEILVYCKMYSVQWFETWWRYCIDNTVAQQEGWDYPFVPPVPPDETDFLEQATDGFLWSNFTDLPSWWKSNNDWDTSLDCNVCEYAGGDFGLYATTVGLYPPYTPYNGGLWSAYFSEVTLEWDHPVAEKQVLFLQKQSSDPADYTVGNITVFQDILVDVKVTNNNYIQYLDVRLPQGAFVISRRESVQAQFKGLRLIYPHGYAPLDGRDTDPYNHDTTEHLAKWQIQEAVGFEVVDPFVSTKDSELLLLDEGEFYEYEDSRELATLDIMRTWNPIGPLVTYSTTSWHEPAVVNNTSGHDWRRKNFSWEYSYLTVEGTHPSRSMVEEHGLEPYLHDFRSEDTMAILPWLGWRQLLCGEKNAIKGGASWQDGVGVCFSYTHERSLDGSGAPNPRPVSQPTVFTQPVHVNYITKGDLSAIITPGDRCYPIGVM
jgi:hypothetical protein